jgi:hypothetical protein
MHCIAVKFFSPTLDERSGFLTNNVVVSGESSGIAVYVPRETILKEMAAKT